MNNSITSRIFKKQLSDLALAMVFFLLIMCITLTLVNILTASAYHNTDLHSWYIALTSIIYSVNAFMFIAGILSLPVYMPEFIYQGATRRIVYLTDLASAIICSLIYTSLYFATSLAITGEGLPLHTFVSHNLTMLLCYLVGYLIGFSFYQWKVIVGLGVIALLLLVIVATPATLFMYSSNVVVETISTVDSSEGMDNLNAISNPSIPIVTLESFFILFAMFAISIALGFVLFKLTERLNINIK